MDCHGNLAEVLGLPPEARRLVLAGNPNVGKSVLFNALTGIYVDVSNYPGTTLEIYRGRYSDMIVLDTPGVYGVSSFSQEEIIARDVILAADIILNVVDAAHLERDLFLTLQICDMGLPLVVALNMVDEAARDGRDIDIFRLQEMLGVPVVPTVAIKDTGLAELKNALLQARPGNPDLQLLPGRDTGFTRLLAQTGNRAEALLIQEGDSYVAQRHGLAGTPGRQEEIYLRRRERVNEIIAAVVFETSRGASLGTRLGRIMLRPASGLPLLALVLFLLYEFVGVFIAQTVVGVTENRLMQGYYEPAVIWLAGLVVSTDSWLGELLIGEFGVLTMTVTYIAGLLLPLVLGFYFSLSVLEDSGYLPRIATLVDRVLVGMGLNGRGVIPLILGLGCVTMAIVTTRLLSTERERKIATFLLAMAVPCSAQLAVIVGLLAGVGAGYVMLYAAIIFGLLVAVGTILDRFLPGQATPLLIDLPPLRLPRLKNVWSKTYAKSRMFLREASPLFAGGALGLGVLQVSGILIRLQTSLAPLTVGWLQLPKEAANAFIMGFVRRDFGAAGLFGLPLTSMQKVVALVTITIFVPCIASVLVIAKERGRREAVLIWSTVIVLAFLIGGVLSQVLIR